MARTTASQYEPDQMRGNKARAERRAFERLKTEPTRTFAAPDAAYRPLAAAEVVKRNSAS